MDLKGKNGILIVIPYAATRGKWQQDLVLGTRTVDQIMVHLLHQQAPIVLRLNPLGNDVHMIEANNQG